VPAQLAEGLVALAIAGIVVRFVQARQVAQPIAGVVPEPA
jgi:hypothetical protein